MRKNRSLEAFFRVVFALNAITDSGNIDVDKVRGKWMLDKKIKRKEVKGNARQRQNNADG